MKKNNPVFGVLFAVAVAAVFLAVSYPKTTSNAQVNQATAGQYYQLY